MQSSKLFAFVRNVVISASIVVTMTFFLLFPEKYTSAVRDAISLWAISVLPSSFPFLFLTAIFSSLPAYRWLARTLSPIVKKLFRVSGEGGCIAVLSALSGYPVGAKLLLTFTQTHAPNERERFRLACLCSSSGPIFLIGVVGNNLFASGTSGWILLLSHLLGVYLVCFFLRFGKEKTAVLPPLFSQRKQSALAENLHQSILSVLCIGGYIVIFSVFMQMLEDVQLFALLSHISPFSPQISRGILSGLLEMTSGCALLARENGPFALALSCFLITFGGACVLTQQLSYLSKANVPCIKFIAVKLLQAVLSACICYLFARSCAS